jgi:hypothetical protein
MFWKKDSAEESTFVPLSPALIPAVIPGSSMSKQYDVVADLAEIDPQDGQEKQPLGRRQNAPVGLVRSNDASRTGNGQLHQHPQVLSNTRMNDLLTTFIA